ncbi:MAG: DUF11 domain-containing protein [Candidatus Saccharimonadales bacterium]
MKSQEATIKMPKLSMRLAAVMAVGAATIITGVSALAWGPERPTFTGENPADYVTFNSMTNNAKVGDERNFVRIREAGTGNYVNEMKLEPNKEYEVSTFYHNNAKDSLNESGKGIAKDTTLKFQAPSIVKVGERGTISSTITASNAQPNKVWDEAFVTTDTDLALRYVPGSARVNSNGAVNGQVLPDEVFTTGTLLGYDSLNGDLPGCTQYSGFVTYKIKTDAPNFTLKKQVSKKGEGNWQDKIVAKLGEEVDFLISYQNTGSTQQKDVVIKDALPTGMTHVPGSVSLANSANPQGSEASDAIFTNGANIGAYDPKGTAFIKLSAKVNEELEKCGVNDLVNHATAITPNGNKQDNAIVTVETECAPGETPVTPTTPTELPQTGPAEVILSLIGIAALAAGIAYWYKSRQDLKKALAEGTDAHAAKSTAADAPKLLKARTDSKSSDDKKDF